MAVFCWLKIVKNQVSKYELCKCCANGKNKNAINLIIRLIAFYNVVLLGFEPRQADPETAVLPLHHKTVEIIIDQNHSFGNFQGKNG